MDDQIKIISEWLGTGSIDIYGLPFAGKDTQGRKLADLFGGVMISGGDILRHNQANEKVQQIMANGGIIPSDLFEEIMLPYFSRPELQGKPLIFSEIGRLKDEAEVVMRAAASSGHPLKAAVLLKLSAEEVWRRFEAAKIANDRGDRADDRREVLQTRLDEFQEKVIPVIELYRDLGILVEVDGALQRKEVTSEILAGLVGKAKLQV